MSDNPILDDLFGLCVGDALGVPVEFSERAELTREPVTGMIGNRQPHFQPPGTWSDDSSLVPCLAESLCHGFDPQDMADRFCRWYDDAYWTPHGSVFDVGGATHIALLRLKQGVNPIEAGGKGEFDNGNGSLMRILPLAYYLQTVRDTSTRLGMIHDVSAIAHAHPRSQLACGIYIQYALYLLNGAAPHGAYEQTQRDILDYYREAPYSEELDHFERILRQDISGYAEEEIRSSTYVVHTLEAALWCLLRHDSYRSTVLAAVNLGDDTAPHRRGGRRIGGHCLRC